MSQLTIEQAMSEALQNHQAGRLAEAERIYRQVLATQPQNIDALHLLGVLAGQAGQPGAGVELIRQAIALHPRIGAFHSNLGKLLLDSGRRDEAMASFRAAIALGGGDLGSAYFNLGTALVHARKIDEAVDAFRRSLEFQPRDVEALNNLGQVLRDSGEGAEAIACFRKAIAINPQNALVHSNLVYALHFHPDYDAARLLQEHRQWNAQHAVPLKQFALPHNNDRTPNRRLRIGYISPDLREHVVGRFLLPLLQQRDRQAVEVIGYSDVAAPDAVTVKIQAECDLWRPIAGQSDEQVAALIRGDSVDVLVDLTMHMAGNRLLLFARRPAPVQVTYLAYCSTTGLDAMDYRISDPYLDPPDMNDAEAYCERTIRLPETYWCYAPVNEDPIDTAAPADTTGSITFGCLNNFSKISEATLKTWGELLQKVPASRLILHANEGSHRPGVTKTFAAMGIEPNRVEFVGFLPLHDYLAQYRRIDIALDPFPYGGGTTTCDALWLGVPVVTLSGRTAVGRGGVSILSNIGLSELIAHTTSEYIEIATALANDSAQRHKLRNELRDRLRRSPLMDAPRFARHMEAAYRQMWTRWCAS